ncbi:MAG: precorrin-8X methylmutase [Oligoflexus sp.]
MNDMRQMTATGRAIEAGSFDVIDAEVGQHHFNDKEWQIVRRVIHSTADFEYKDLTTIHRQAIPSGTRALLQGAAIISDVRMIQVGLNQQRLEQYGCRTYCFISDDDVIAKAMAANSTRAIESMRKAHELKLLDGAIIAIGNAPTALLEVKRLIDEEGAKPALVIGVPVGFISAAESKDEILKSPVPSIVTRGRKGGSPIAVAIIHALLALSVES